MLRDPRRLYAPGRLYHIVERKPFRMGRFPPVVRTAVPVDGGLSILFFLVMPLLTMLSFGLREKPEGLWM
ncbi:hypothetical protein CK203_091887 [Vitis vinifera]|uniref:Uncharacterized protein n=1 Tax=Vitis vinifera TaxID=29760 RepID=A0A438E2M7_VITVI|nr:hypothetical protein CK203_091887 [Vitis vinifera]